MYIDVKRKAIVIGTDNHNSLGVIRSLGMKGIPVELIVITNDVSKKTAVEYSKYLKGAYRIVDPYKELIPTLMRIGESHEDYRSILYATSDTTASIVDFHKDQLEKNFIIPKVNRSDVNLDYWLDKLNTNILAQKMGLNVPKSKTIDFSTWTEDFWDDYPCIIKPVTSMEGKKTDIRVIYNKNELLSYIDTLKKSYSKALIQEYINGSNSKMVGLVGLVTQDNNVYITGIMDKSREFPLNTGSTSYGKFTENNFNIDLDKVKKFIKATGYCGVFDFDFKYSNGESYFIEMNFRNGALSYASTAGGVNLPYLWYLDASGLDITSQIKEVESNFSFMLEIRDFKHIFKGNIKLTSWVKDLFNTDTFLVLNKSDIKPNIMKVLSKF